MVTDFTNNIREADAAVVETIGNLRLMERDHHDAEVEAQKWGDKARAVSSRADVFRAKGKTGEADKFDVLATSALRRQIASETRVNGQSPQIERQNQTVEQLKQELTGMHEKLEQLKTRRAELLGRAKVTREQSRVLDAVKSIDTSDSASELGRFEDNVRRQEALAAGKQELAASSLESHAEFRQNVLRPETGWGMLFNYSALADSTVATTARMLEAMAQAPRSAISTKMPPSGLAQIS